MDVTRTKIPAPSVEPWSFYSYKDRFHALKTEIGVSLRKPNKIIWVNSGYKGVVADITIARSGFIQNLRNGQLALADLGYLGEPEKLLTPIKKKKGQELTDVEKNFNYRHNQERQIVERVNKRLKIFKVVEYWNRKDFQFHEICVHAVAKITNLNFQINPL